MTTEKFNDDAMDTEGGFFNELLNRPWDCTALGMELKTAIKSKDLACCRELLRQKGKWLGEFKGHEYAELMDAAIHAGDAASDLITVLLDAGVPAHCVYDTIGENYQHTPLITAARRGRLDLVRKLVAAGADLDWKSPTGTNALSELYPAKASQAAIADTPELARVREWLEQQGLTIDPLCADSRRKLVWASSSPDSWPDIPGLIHLGVPLDGTGWTPFMYDLAAGRADERAVANLEPDQLQHRDAWKRTPFLLAVAAGNLDLARFLMARGSDIHTRAHCGASALHLAAQYNYPFLIEWLADNGLPLDVRDEFGHSALHSAVGANSVQAAELLLNMGADVHERDENGFALVHDVWFGGDLAMLKLLLAAGANVNDVSGGGDWPLRDACHDGNADAVAFLLQMGANPNLTSTGDTALFTAVSSDSLGCVRQLVEAGADVNAMDCDGWTCLFHLCSEQVARYLLEHGASPEIEDQCGGLPENWERVPMPVRKLLKDWRSGNTGTDATSANS